MEMPALSLEELVIVQGRMIRHLFAAVAKIDDSELALRLQVLRIDLQHYPDQLSDQDRRLSQAVVVLLEDALSRRPPAGGG